MPNLIPNTTGLVFSLLTCLTFQNQSQRRSSNKILKRDVYDFFIIFFKLDHVTSLNKKQTGTVFTSSCSFSTQRKILSTVQDQESS